jgi:hypothetical protein
MNAGLVIADVARAGGHAAVLGIVLGVAAVGGLVFALVRRASKARAGRARAGAGVDDAQRPGT